LFPHETLHSLTKALNLSSHLKSQKVWVQMQHFLRECNCSNAKISQIGGFLHKM